LVGRWVILLDAALKHATAVRLIHAIGERTKSFGPVVDLFIRLPYQLGLTPTISRMLSFVIQFDRPVLVCLGFIENREAMAGSLSEVGRMVVVPTVSAADGIRIVLTL